MIDKEQQIPPPNPVGKDELKIIDIYSVWTICYFANVLFLFHFSFCLFPIILYLFNHLLTSIYN